MYVCQVVAYDLFEGTSFLLSVGCFFVTHRLLLAAGIEESVTDEGVAFAVEEEELMVSSGTLRCRLRFKSKGLSFVSSDGHSVQGLK